MDISMLDRMSRRELQSLAKTLAIPANQKSELIIEAIKSRSHTEANSSSAVTRDSEPLDDQDFFSLPQPPSVSSPNISLIPFKASQLVESPTLIIKPAATPLRPSSPDRMRKETTTGKTPLTGRSMSVARRVPIDQPRPQQRSQTPNRSSFPSRPLTPSSQPSHLAQRPKTPARTAFGGRTEPTTPRASGMIQPSHHRPLTPRSQSFGGAGMLRPSTPGRNQTPVRNQTPGRKSVAGIFPLSPRPSAPHAQGPLLNKSKGQENDAKVAKVGEMLAIRASDLPFPAEIKLKMRKALLPSTNSSRFILMHSSESGLSSKEVGSAIVSSIAGELVKKQGNVAFPQRQKPAALYYDLRKALSDENSAKASADIKSLLKGPLSSTLPNRQPSQSILILDGLETLRENQRLDMDSAMNACEASSALIEGLDLYRKSRSGGGGGGGGSKENAPGLAPVIVVLVRSSGQSLESCVDETIVKRMTGGVIHLDKSLKDVFLPAPPLPPVRASTILLPFPTPQPLQLAKVSPHPAIKEIACSDEEREEWLVMRLMEIEAALGVEDVEQLVKLTAGLSVNGLSKLFSQALEKSKCKDGLADVLFFSHFESILMI